MAQPYDEFEISVSGTALVDPASGIVMGGADDELHATVAWINGKLVITDVWHDRQGTIEGTPMGKLVADAIRTAFADEASQRYLLTMWGDAMEEARAA